MSKTEDFVHTLVFPNGTVGLNVPFKDAQAGHSRCETEPLLLFVKLLFSPLSRGDVLHDGNEIVGSAFGFANHGNGQVRPYQGAILAKVALLPQVVWAFAG